MHYFTMRKYTTKTKKNKEKTPQFARSYQQER